jgi:hypothetical protein
MIYLAKKEVIVLPTMHLPISSKFPGPTLFRTPLPPLPNQAEHGLHLAGGALKGAPDVNLTTLPQYSPALNPVENLGHYPRNPIGPTAVTSIRLCLKTPDYAELSP